MSFSYYVGIFHEGEKEKKEREGKRGKEKSHSQSLKMMEECVFFIRKILTLYILQFSYVLKFVNEIMPIFHLILNKM